MVVSLHFYFIQRSKEWLGNFISVLCKCTNTFKIKVLPVYSTFYTICHSMNEKLNNSTQNDWESYVLALSFSTQLYLLYLRKWVIHGRFEHFHVSFIHVQFLGYFSCMSSYHTINLVFETVFLLQWFGLDSGQNVWQPLAVAYCRFFGFEKYSFPTQESSGY